MIALYIVLGFMLYTFLGRLYVKLSLTENITYRVNGGYGYYSVTKEEYDAHTGSKYTHPDFNHRLFGDGCCSIWVNILYPFMVAIELVVLTFKLLTRGPIKLADMVSNPDSYKFRIKFESKKPDCLNTGVSNCHQSRAENDCRTCNHDDACN